MDPKASPVLAAAPSAMPVEQDVPRWRRSPALALALTCVFVALTLVPRIGDHPDLVRTFLITGALLLGWAGLLWLRRGRRPNAFRIDVPPVPRTHSVQPTLQLAIYAYWGYYWPDVYAHTPLFVAQALFLYTVDALLAWSRGRAWRLGLGPLPIVLSTNVFLWFHDEYYGYQFLLMAVAAFGKEFIQWTRDGRRRHIFNPSAFAISVFAVVLIATDSTHITRGPEIATTIFRPPHIYLEIFLLGLVVQYLFGTVLMTMGAALALFVLNHAYTAATGVYFFIDTNIAAAVFLGMHLLVTDPATSPRTSTGKLVFGILYGACIALLYWILGSFGAPQFYDKLLPIPILNLSVRFIDRVAEGRLFGRLTRWEAALPRKRTNLAAMGCWIALFATMYGTGFIASPHEGRSLAFWRDAQLAGKRHAGDKLLQLASTRAARDSGTALNALGVLYLEGDAVDRDPALAAHWFAEACAAGSDRGCMNVARLAMLSGMSRSPADVARALAHMEERVDVEPDGEMAFLLGLAHETGRVPIPDGERAASLYALGCELGNADACKGVARAIQHPIIDAAHAQLAAVALEQACMDGDAESCLLLAFAYDMRPELANDPDQVRRLLQLACDLGEEDACAAVASRYR